MSTKTADNGANIQPLADYVVAQAEEAASKTASGLYLPENAKEKPKTAKVIAVGPGKSVMTTSASQ